MLKELGVRVGRARRIGFVVRMIDGAIETAARESILGYENTTTQSQDAVATYLKNIYTVATKNLIGGELEIGDLQDAVIYEIKDKRRNADVLKSIVKPLVSATLHSHRMEGELNPIVELIDETINSFSKPPLEDTAKVIIVKKLITKLQKKEKLESRSK